MKIHRHNWHVDSASLYADVWNEFTFLTVQCKKCAKVKKLKIANVLMTGKQVNNYVLARYNQITRFDNSAFDRLKSIYG